MPVVQRHVRSDNRVSTALEWRDVVDLESNRPAIQLRAATTKAKRADVVPLHPDLAGLLRDAKPPFALSTDRLFRTVPRLLTLKRDLPRAGIMFADEQGRTVDRHATRTIFGSWLNGLRRSRASTTYADATRRSHRHRTALYGSDASGSVGGDRQVARGWRCGDPARQRATGTDDSVAPLVTPRAVRKGVRRSKIGRMGDTSVSSKNDVTRARIVAYAPESTTDARTRTGGLLLHRQAL